MVCLGLITGELRDGSFNDEYWFIRGLAEEAEVSQWWEGTESLLSTVGLLGAWPRRLSYHERGEGQGFLRTVSLFGVRLKQL